MPIFHDLRVSALEPLTDDAVKITLEVPDPLREEYRFVPGQHLTFGHEGETGLIRRTFSICSTPASGELSVAVKVLPAGVFSGFVAHRLRVGDRLPVMTPAGRFSSRPRPGEGPRTVVAIVAGSGITPVMSIMTTLLETEPETRFVLCYGNRRATSVMFAEEIADLKDRFLNRLEVFHMISSETHAAPLLSGRIDAERLRLLLQLHPPHEVDEWFVCGPLGLIEVARATLIDHGVSGYDIHREVFFTGRPPSRPTGGDVRATEGTVTFRLDGRTSTVALLDRRIRPGRGAQRPARGALRLPQRRVRYVPDEAARGRSADGAELRARTVRSRGRLPVGLPIRAPDRRSGDRLRRLGSLFSGSTGATVIRLSMATRGTSVPFKSGVWVERPRA